MVRRWTPWVLLALVLAFIYASRGVLLPFLAGFAIAYLLDPVADRLERWGMGRGLAAVLILLAFFLAIAGLFVGLWPLLEAQLAGLVQALPGALEKVKPFVSNIVEVLHDRYDVAIEQNADNILSSLAENGLSRLSEVTGAAVSQGLALFSLLGLLLISPVVAFYMLRDYDRIIDNLDRLLPAEHEPVIREQVGLVDQVLSGFVRGQILICAIMGAIYATGWSLAGLKFGLILGILAGIMAFIPFVGMLFAAAVAMLLAFGQFGADPVKLSMVAGVWIFVQVLEGAFLTPKLVGERVGLHPIWVLFAVFAGGEVAGFVGVLLAVPAAAVIAVLIRFIVSEYLTRVGRQDVADRVHEHGLMGAGQATPDQADGESGSRPTADPDGSATP